MTEFERASVVITGASQGIGRHIALKFAKETQRTLILIARSETGLRETRDLIKQTAGNRVVTVPCDASDISDVNSFSLNEEIPKPAIIINNAGNFLLKPLYQTTSREFHEQLEANLFTAVNITNRFLPQIKKRSRGLIINICSVSALHGLPESGAYSSAKHALLGYTRSLREELKSTDIGVTAVILGQTESPSWEGSEIDRDLLIDPKDVGSVIVDITTLTSRTVVEEILIQPQHGRVPPM